jgi:hypothetical protein
MTIRILSNFGSVLGIAIGGAIFQNRFDNQVPHSKSAALCNKSRTLPPVGHKLFPTDGGAYGVCFEGGIGIIASPLAKFLHR